MSTVNEFAAAKSSDRVVVIDDDPRHGLSVASCRLSGPNVIWDSKIVSPTKNSNGDSVKISPCGNWAIIHPRPNEEGQGAICSLDNGVICLKDFVCGDGIFGFCFDRIPDNRNRLAPATCSINMVGLVTNLANCNSLRADSCVGGDQYRWEQTPDICRKPIWSHSSRFFAYSDDGMYNIFRVDSEHGLLLLRQSIPYLRGKAICADYYCGKDGVEHLAISEMGGPIRRFRTNGSGVFCEMWARDSTAGHAVDILLSHAEESSPSVGVTTTALIYHLGNNGFSIERYTEENELVKARLFPNEGNPAASQLFNSGDSLLVSPMRYFGLWH